MIRIRTLTRASEYDAAVDLERKVWGWTDVELFPAPMFVVVNRIGGQSFGAYDEDRMAGFCVALPALKPNGMHYLHSHMLAVLNEYQNQGIGRRLKLRQREDALARGISRIEWTFDPLEI
ncbi:MAG: GNAT family N-acetyltransferase, partial [Acidobacteria bacterium]|nr:GNAT family N-acetyltransferase [Acidobacteriota bacterium]